MKSKSEPQSINLAFYFFLLVAFIIFVSIVFKIADVVRHSKFDGKHTFSVAILEKDKTSVIFASPQTGTIVKLDISPKVGKETLTSLGVPSDGYIKSTSDITSSPKSTFFKTIFRRNSTQTDLTVLDLLRLSIFARGVGEDKLTNQVVSIKDSDFSDIVGELFIDPQIDREKVSIVITNATQTPGLGNKVAKYIGNMGANVVLVNSSPASAKYSVIYFNEKSYTVDRISKVLGIKKVMKTGNPIADVTIIIGEDKANL